MIKRIGTLLITTLLLTVGQMLISALPASANTSLPINMASASTEQTASFKACKAEGKINVRKNNDLLRVQADVRELQTQCAAQRAAVGPRPWKEPCDARSRVPGGYEPSRELTISSAFSIEPDFTSEQLETFCASATQARCSWRYDRTVHVTPFPFSTNPVEHDDYVVLWVRLVCPSHPNPLIIDGIEFARARRSISVAEFNARSGRDVLHQRAVEASLLLDLPNPVAVTRWRYEGDVAYTLVNGYTWFATRPGVFQPKEKRVNAGNTWVQVTAQPTGLGFEANGEQTSWCEGPGVLGDPVRMENLRQEGVGPVAVQPPPDGCAHKFTQTSPGFPDQPVMGTLSIRWAVSYVGSGGVRSSLPDMHTSTTVGPFVVTEAQALVTK